MVKSGVTSFDTRREAQRLATPTRMFLPVLICPARMEMVKVTAVRAGAARKKKTHAEMQKTLSGREDREKTKGGTRKWKRRHYRGRY
jgi:hypothetical protein